MLLVRLQAAVATCLFSVESSLAVYEIFSGTTMSSYFSPLCLRTLFDAGIPVWQMQMQGSGSHIEIHLGRSPRAFSSFATSVFSLPLERAVSIPLVTADGPSPSAAASSRGRSRDKSPPGSSIRGFLGMPADAYSRAGPDVNLSILTLSP
jgi:hypothetical protein